MDENNVDQMLIDEIVSEFNALSNEEKINLWVLGFSNGRFSDEYIANFSSTPIRNGNDVSGSFDITCDIRYKNT